MLFPQTTVWAILMAQTVLIAVYGPACTVKSSLLSMFQQMTVWSVLMTHECQPPTVTAVAFM